MTKVHLVFLNDAVLGVFASNAGARLEAEYLMARYGGPWVEITPNLWTDAKDRRVSVEARNLHGRLIHQPSAAPATT